MNENETKTEIDPAVYKTLLESTKAIPWKIDWKSMGFAYIGPQIENLLGWSPESWVSAADWAARMHPDDSAWVVDYCVSQSQNGIDHEADYRALTKDGSHVWIRDVVHVVRNNNGEVESLVGFMFDISERKISEEKVLALQKELETLSYKDGLTGVANRRMFDSVLAVEWANARRNNQPLSLVILDIDSFKQYNDHYGHVQGDDCLRRVGRCLGLAATRPRDFLARYGGEEFVWVLPETNEEFANELAERCRSLIIGEQIPHEKSQDHQILTISLGVGTLTPSPQDDLISFIEAVDRRLYQAKKKGKNCVVQNDEPLFS